MKSYNYFVYIMKNSINYILIFLLFLIFSCEKKDNKIIGQIVGAAVGGYLGSKVGTGVSKDIATILGGAAGYILGGKIVQILSEDEKNEFNSVIEESLDNNPDNTPEPWNSSTHEETSGEVIPLNSYLIKNNTCRDFKKIIKKNNEIFEEKSTACRNEDGNWILI